MITVVTIWPISQIASRNKIAEHNERVHNWREWHHGISRGATSALPLCRCLQVASTVASIVQCNDTVGTHALALIRT